MGRVIAIFQQEHGVPRTGPPRRNDRLVPVLDLIRERGMLGKPVLAPRCASMDEADAMRRDLYAAARYYCSCGARYCTRKHDNISGCPDGGMRLSCHADIVRDARGALRVQVTVFDKAEGIRSVVARYGPDPAAWPYQSKARKRRGT
jgi:hypothetical protein